MPQDFWVLARNSVGSSSGFWNCLPSPVGPAVTGPGHVLQAHHSHPGVLDVWVPKSFRHQGSARLTSLGSNPRLQLPQGAQSTFDGHPPPDCWVPAPLGPRALCTLSCSVNLLGPIWKLPTDSKHRKMGEDPGSSGGSGDYSGWGRGGAREPARIFPTTGLPQAPPRKLPMSSPAGRAWLGAVLTR